MLMLFSLLIIAPQNGPFRTKLQKIENQIQAYNLLDRKLQNPKLNLEQMNVHSKLKSDTKEIVSCDKNTHCLIIKTKAVNLAEAIALHRHNKILYAQDNGIAVQVNE